MTGRVAAPRPTVAYLALGSNLGDRAAHLGAARAGLNALPDTRVVAASPVEETAPLGVPGQGAYLNQMLHVETALAAAALLAGAQAIERAAGRVRDPAVRWGPRTLDIDVVLFGGEIVDLPGLRVPHPELARRDFWQRELAQLGVDWRAALDAAGAVAAGAAA